MTDNLFIAQATFRIYIIIYRETQKCKKQNDLLKMENSIKDGKITILYKKGLILTVKTILLA